ncbi:MAG: hypothetical protein R2839_04725 [Thermomicrobiales bacterium]
MPDDSPSAGALPDQDGLSGVVAEGEDDPESTVGVGSAFAIGCSLIVVIILLGGVCYFIAQQVR